MHKDIREVLKNNVDNKEKLSQNHRNRFQERLTKELHEEKKERFSYKWLFVAASIALLLGVTFQVYINTTVIEPVPAQDTDKSLDISTQRISLGSISPELKTVESYYINTINYELSQLELTEENKELFDGYISQLEGLTKEYKSLTDELNTKGINDDTINALIGNLQLRLQLLKRMQKQLHEFKNPNQNDIQTI
ncbi:hypothetical protein SAMN04489761_0200 [Tenacibaculum sp. MAR_2009_124]|uniref:hypothetical protein n=1 Tax=Tenacibaculum sp. MAR_2009_124 TaxID=1250059 RepID=UPI0008945076|nr:hypothetical protein [Tenacibaculum sp. MAR_2009_124]SEB36850.1 hypothetical protein SAMN04489761_0200 [Tenacibaculum sp. MAR_2009_124]